MERGWRVFPVQGKRPATAHGLLDASRDFDLLEEWWPGGTDRGLALATGSASGVWVVDLDGPEAVTRFIELQESRGAIPPTMASRTARGFHIFFQMPPSDDVRNSAGRVAEGVDVRGSGGYVVLPPSPHPSGARYEWAPGRGPDDLVPAVAPAWLLALVQSPTTVEKRANPPDFLPSDRSGSRSRYVQAAVEQECREVSGAAEGQRNHRLNAAAFSLARFVVAGEADPASIVRELAHAAACAGLKGREISRTVESAFRARGIA